MAIIGITGATGLIGSYLIPLLVRQGHTVIGFSRHPASQKPGKNTSWALLDTHKALCDAEALSRVEVLVHLAGESVAAHRWTAAQKEKIRSSRVDGTLALGNMLRQHAPNCHTIVAASAIGYYGPDSPDHKPFLESYPPATDFLADVCVQWENAIHQIGLGKRVVFLRTGIVLALDSGAFAEFIKPTRFGVLPVLGAGRQIISWIHIADMAGMYAWAINEEQASGAYNAVAPHPVSNTELMRTIRSVAGKPYIMPHVPEFALKIVLGEMSVEVLKSCTVSSAKAEQAGYTFRYPNADAAVRNLLDKA